MAPNADQSVIYCRPEVLCYRMEQRGRGPCKKSVEWTATHGIKILAWRPLNKEDVSWMTDAMVTREHWIQRITFAAETNAAGTHTAWQTDAERHKYRNCGDGEWWSDDWFPWEISDNSLARLCWNNDHKWYCCCFYSSANVVRPEALCFLAVRESVCLSVRVSWTLLTLWLEMYWTYFHQTFSIGSILAVKRSKFKVRVGPTCWKLHFLALLMQRLENYWVSPNYQLWCTLGQRFNLEVKRSKARSVWPRAKRAEAYRAVRQVLISS